MGTETALQIGGAGMSAVGAMRNSQGTQQAYAAQAQVARNNEQIAGWQAQDAIQRGGRTVVQSRIQTAQTKGAQRARLAAAGVDLGEGSALNILADTDYFGEIDVNTITDNAAREAWAIRQQAAGFKSEASLLQSRADSESPWMAGATSLLTSAGKVAGGWYGGKSSPRTDTADPLAKWRRTGSGGD